jgi:hypothetical protein
MVTVRGANIEGLDIEAAAGKEAGHTREDAEFIFNEDGNGVSHEGGVRSGWTAQDSNL